MKTPRGNPRLAEQRNSDTTNANATRVAAADEFAANLLPVLIQLALQDMSMRAQADWLNGKGHRTRGQKAWSERAVRRVWERVRVKRIQPPAGVRYVISESDISGT